MATLPAMSHTLIFQKFLFSQYHLVDYVVMITGHTRSRMRPRGGVARAGGQAYGVGTSRA